MWRKTSVNAGEDEDEDEDVENEEETLSLKTSRMGGAEEDNTSIFSINFFLLLWGERKCEEWGERVEMAEERATEVMKKSDWWILSC